MIMVLLLVTWSAAGKSAQDCIEPLYLLPHRGSRLLRQPGSWQTPVASPVRKSLPRHQYGSNHMAFSASRYLAWCSLLFSLSQNCRHIAIVDQPVFDAVLPIDNGAGVFGEQDAITRDNVLTQVDTSVFYRIIEPEKTVYRIRDVDSAISTTVAGIVRAEIGKMDLDEVQANRNSLIDTIKSMLSKRWMIGGSKLPVRKFWT